MPSDVVYVCGIWSACIIGELRTIGSLLGCKSWPVLLDSGWLINFAVTGWGEVVGGADLIGSGSSRLSLSGSGWWLLSSRGIDWLDIVIAWHCWSYDDFPVSLSRAHSSLSPGSSCN